MPRKMRRLALRSALSAKVASDEMVVVNELVFDTSKTANAVEFLKSLDIQTSAVILLPDRNENVEKSVHNLPFVKTLRANYLNIRDILGHDYIIVPQESISVIESFLG
jgi:large subunit ribosomal protein L4